MHACIRGRDGVGDECNHGWEGAGELLPLVPLITPFIIGGGTVSNLKAG